MTEQLTSACGLNDAMDEGQLSRHERTCPACQERFAHDAIFKALDVFNAILYGDDAPHEMLQDAIAAAGKVRLRAPEPQS